MSTRFWTSAGLVVVVAALAGCSTLPSSSPAASNSSAAGITSSATSVAGSPSQVTTGGPPSTLNASPAWNSPAHVQSFFAQIEPAATAAMKSTGIPASVLMAIAGQESGFGTTSLATTAKNLFAQACAKSSNCVGGYMRFKDWGQSIQAFAAKVAGSPVVQAVMAVAPGAVGKITSAIAGLQSLDPNLTQDVTALIGQYHLRQNDILGS